MTDPPGPPDPGYEPELDEHHDWLRARARSQLGERLRRVLDSEDLAQETELAALEGMAGKRFPNRRAFRGWLGTILRNLAARRGRRAGATAEGSLDAVLGRERSPSSAVRAAELGRRMRALMGRLPERDRNLVALRLVDDLSFREVAERMSVSEANARMIFSRSVKRMRELAGEDGARR
jgi:RNA polymerase sigma-70 factor (ECF subfamily)